MPARDDNAKIRWEDGVPVSTRFDDPYYSREDGLAETRHVFLAANRLPARFAGAEDFQIAELGFGSGLNFLAALALWRAVAPPGAVLRYTAFELYPMSPPERAQALTPWPDLPDWPGESEADVVLEIIEGDARQTLLQWEGKADAWFLDGFAPARNPEMWEASLLGEVGRHTRERGSFATYSAAGHVRRALTAAGFMVERQAGYGRKREMLAGCRQAETYD